MLDLLFKIASIVSAIMGIVTAVVFFVKPIREKILSTKKINNGGRCLLRSEMLSIFYNGVEKGEIRQYEYENFIYMYEAYKELGGNSFMDDVYKTVRTWKIIT